MTVIREALPAAGARGVPPARCRHEDPCPSAQAPDREAARTVVRHELQGWSLLCNGIVVFDDLGELLPDATAVAPREVRRCPPALRPPVVVRSAETRS